MQASTQIHAFDTNCLSFLCGEQLLLGAILGNSAVRRSIDRELKRRTRRVLLRYLPDHAANATARISRAALAYTTFDDSMDFAA